MAKKYLMIEQYHLTMRVPDDLPDEEAEAVRDALDSRSFIAKLRKALATFVAGHTSLTVVQVSVSR